MSIIFLCFFSSLFSYASTDQIDTMANRLIELRKEIDLLNQKYDLEKKQYTNELNIIHSQRAEFESNLRNEEIRSKQLSRKIQDQESNIEIAQSSDAGLIDLFEKNSERLLHYINSALPVKTNERKSAVENLQKLVREKDIELSKAVSSLYTLIGDELRLTRENSLYSATLEINDSLQLSRLAKIGMLQLYFETTTGLYGQAVKEDGQWKYKTFKNSTEQKNLQEVFDGLSKQIRTGFYQLPNLAYWSKEK